MTPPPYPVLRNIWTAPEGSTFKVLFFWARREEGRDVGDQVTRGDVLANWREADRTLLA